MPRFQYRGTTAQGVHQSGEIEAADEQSAFAALRQRQVSPFEIVLIKESVKVEDLLQRRRKVPADVLVVFTRQLATMIDAGVSVFNALVMLSEQQDNVRFAEALSRVSNGVEQGMALADAFALEAGIFSPLYTAMIRAGEESGTLDEALRQLSLQLERDSRLRKQIKAAMRYPIIVLCFAALVTLILLLFVVPTFVSLFTDLGGQLPLPTQMIVGLSQVLIPPDGRLIPVLPIIFIALTLAAFVLSVVLFVIARLPGGLSMLIAVLSAVIIGVAVFTVQFEPNLIIAQLLPSVPGGVGLSVWALEHQLPTAFVSVPTAFATLGRILMLAAMVFASRAIWRWWINTEQGRWWWDRFRLNAPLKIGSVVQKVAVARFTRTLSTLTRTQVPILTAFDIVRGTSGNVLIEKAAQDARDHLVAGSTIAEPLAAANVFPPMVTRMIKVGEETGSLDTMLLKAAEYYEEEVEIAMKNLAAIIEPIMIIVVGAVVGTVVISLYLPMFRIYDLIGQLNFLIPFAWGPARRTILWPVRRMRREFGDGQ